MPTVCFSPMFTSPVCGPARSPVGTRRASWRGTGHPSGVSKELRVLAGVFVSLGCEAERALFVVTQACVKVIGQNSFAELTVEIRQLGRRVDELLQPPLGGPPWVRHY